MSDDRLPTRVIPFIGERIKEDSPPIRTVADQRRLLVETVRAVAHWRYRRAYKFDDAIARKRSLRAEGALRTLANFIEAMADDDRDLCNLRGVAEDEERLALTAASFSLLSRFGIDRGAWSSAGGPSESQMRNVLRRADGIEARERHDRRQGYGGG